MSTFMGERRGVVFVPWFWKSTLEYIYKESLFKYEKWRMSGINKLRLIIPNHRILRILLKITKLFGVLNRTSLAKTDASAYWIARFLVNKLKSFKSLDSSVQEMYNHPFYPGFLQRHLSNLRFSHIQKPPRIFS